MTKPPTKEERDSAEKALEPYQLALGKVAHAWNHMQEQLGLLFCIVTNLDTDMGMGIWHALKSDRNQRDLLQAAVLAADNDTAFKKRFPKAHDDITWMLSKIGALSDSRNSAIHAPVQSLIGGPPELRPITAHGNPNAAKLRGKDIFAEFEWYERYFTFMGHFAANLTLR